MYTRNPLLVIIRLVNVGLTKKNFLRLVHSTDAKNRFEVYVVKKKVVYGNMYDLVAAVRWCTADAVQIFRFKGFKKIIITKSNW